jgi:hypothetical protein
MPIARSWATSTSWVRSACFSKRTPSMLPKAMNAWVPTRTPPIRKKALFVVLALVGGVVARTLEARRANAEAARANREAEAARQVSDFLVSLFNASNPAKSKRDTTALELLDRGAARVQTELKAQPLVRASVLQSLGFVYRSLGLYDKGEPLLRESVAIRRARPGNDGRDAELGLLRVRMALAIAIKEKTL